jgi:oxygen-independent coproporphyrinogen-3 oxidase
MNIIIEQVGFSDHQLSITHLLKLFFQDAECHFQPVEARWDEQDTVCVQMTLTETAEQIKFTLNLQNEWSDEFVLSENVAERRGLIKRMMFRTLLRALEAFTGLSQPWGILTGVRPTKLMHNLLRSGQSLDEVSRLLQEEYLLKPDKVRLLADIVNVQRQVIPDLYQLQNEVSIYIGIPFCPTKCAYCTFPAYDIEQYEGAVPQFLQALIEEIRETGRWLHTRGLKVTTIYWGGGTPTSITAKQMEQLFDELEREMPGYRDIREVTVEAGRPDTITVEKIKLLKQRKVDRMSINPQSFTQETLDVIGRHHTVAETVEKFLLCREHGMDNINMDVIIGLPDEGVMQFAHTLAETEKLMPESLTVHTLSFKRASQMTRNRGQYEVAERDEIGEMMAMAEQWTAEQGYKPYYLYRQKNILGNLENVGYALEGKDSLYNILMMEELQTIIGIGCGAVSKILFHRDGDRIERFANPKEPAQYNATWHESLQRKIKLLDEAYAVESHA